MSKLCSCKDLEKGAAKVGCYWYLNYGVARPKGFLGFIISLFAYFRLFKVVRQLSVGRWNSELCDSLMQEVPEESSPGVRVGRL